MQALLDLHTYLCRPVVRVPDQHVRSQEGRTIALQCEVESFPRATTSWIRRDLPYQQIETGGR